MSICAKTVDPTKVEGGSLDKKNFFLFWYEMSTSSRKQILPTTRGMGVWTKEICFFGIEYLDLRQIFIDTSHWGMFG